MKIGKWFKKKHDGPGRSEPDIGQSVKASAYTTAALLLNPGFPGMSDHEIKSFVASSMPGYDILITRDRNGMTIEARPNINGATTVAFYSEPDNQIKQVIL